MKPSLTPIVSGTFALLVTLALTLTPRSAQASRPDGYTDNGQPYYYAYPNEGTSDEENSGNNPDMSLQMPPDYSSMAPGYDDSYAEPYYDYGGGWLSFGALNGNPNGVRNGNFNRHPRLGSGFNPHGMHRNIPAHSSVVTPARKGGAGGARMAGGGAGHGGGGHR